MNNQILGFDMGSEDQSVIIIGYYENGSLIIEKLIDETHSEYHTVLKFISDNAKLKYRIQYFDENHQLTWSDWRTFDQPIEQEAILGIHLNETITQDHPQYDEYLKFMKENIK